MKCGILPKAEWAAFTIILFIYAVLQINAIRHGNYAGQDFQRNKVIIIEASQDPIKALTHLVGVAEDFQRCIIFSHQESIFGQANSIICRLWRTAI